MKNLKYKMKSINGITLIALVITIVILIILAGVTINLILGNDGILKKAQQATQEYTNAQDYEEEQMAKYTNEINSYVSGNRNDRLDELESRITALERISYSTEEQDTGLKWIDGKKIYQKTIQPNLSIGTDPTQLDLSTYISNIDMLFIDTTHSWCAQNNGDLVPLAFSPASNISEYGITFKTFEKTKLRFYVGTKATIQRYIVKYLTLQYTKTNSSIN